MLRLGWPSRSGVALVVAGLAAIAAVVMAAPMPTHDLWYRHVVLLETSLVTSSVGALALALAAARTGGVARAARLLAGLALVAGLLPLLTAIPALRAARCRFSLLEYVRGPRTPPVRLEKDVVLEPSAPELTADVYHAPGPGPHAFVLSIHGGSWRGGDKGAAVHVSRRLAAFGYTVVDVRYSFAPASSFPQAVREVKCFVGRLRGRAAALGIDPERGALLGRSAGGQIALIAAYSAGDPRIPPSCDVEDRPVKAVISLYAPTDLVWGYENPIHPDVVRGPESIALYLAGPPAARPEAYRLASPLSWAGRPLPRTLLIHGSWDRLVSVGHATRLAAGLAAAGRPVQLLVVPLAEHGFDMRPGGVGEQLASATIAEFLRFALPPLSLAPE